MRGVGREFDPDFDLDVRGPASVCGGEPTSGPYTGIKALMLAVLDNGIACYLSPTPRIHAEAEYWITTNARRSPFSFAVVCETLKLEPDAVRAALQRLREQQDQGPIRGLGRRRQNVRRSGRLLASKSA